MVEVAFSGEIHTRENRGWGGEWSKREARREFDVFLHFLYGFANSCHKTKGPILTINFKVFCLCPGLGYQKFQFIRNRASSQPCAENGWKRWDLE